MCAFLAVTVLAGTVSHYPCGDSWLSLTLWHRLQDGGAVTGDLYDPHQQTFDQPGNAVAPRRMLWEM
jgi:hypothetical protein